MAKVFMTIIVNFRLHQCMWEFDCKRLDKIHIYDFTVWTAICWPTIAIQKEKDSTAKHEKKVEKANLEKKSNGIEYAW